VPIIANDKDDAAPKAQAVARQLIEQTFAAALTGDAAWVKTPPTVDAAILPKIQAVIANTKQLSYRDALVVQFAFWLANNKPTDITVRQEGGRSVAGWLGRFLAANHIRAVSDAFQNIGKNTEVLARGNYADFDDVLRWGAVATRTGAEIEAAFRFTCIQIAANARPVLPMPALDAGNLTFARMSELLSRLFALPSGGAFEQFALAALLHALVEQQGQSEYRVETKNLNASDKSSRAAGDVQILLGTRVVEAFEVTANDWHEKLAGAAKTIRDNDLSRLTIIARGVQASGDALYQELKAHGLDLSVFDLKAHSNSVVSALTRQSRANALRRLYELLDRYQPRVEIVNQYVGLLFALGVVEAAAPTNPEVSCERLSENLCESRRHRVTDLAILRASGPSKSHSLGERLQRRRFLHGQPTATLHDPGPWPTATQKVPVIARHFACRVHEVGLVTACGSQDGVRRRVEVDCPPATVE